LVNIRETFSIPENLDDPFHTRENGGLSPLPLIYSKIPPVVETVPISENWLGTNIQIQTSISASPFPSFPQSPGLRLQRPCPVYK